MDRYSLLQPVTHKKANSVRWQEAEKYGSDVIPLTVADMDFQAPQPIIQSIEELVKEGNFCYVDWSEKYYSSIVKWCQKRYGWNIDSEWIVPIGRMCEVTAEILRELVGEDTNVILPFPSYSPTADAIRAANCHIIPWQLQITDNYYSYDFASLKFLMKDADAIILTNPHNPTGRVWTLEEQRKIAKLAKEMDVFVISDEFHADITFNNKFVPYLSSCVEAKENGIALQSPGKTFNIAGLETASIIVPQKELRTKVKRAVFNSGCHNPRFFAEVATTVAYEKCENWLDQLLELVKAHYQMLQNMIIDLDKIELTKSEGTYLAWIDCRKLGLSDAELKQHLLKQKLLLSSGEEFGQGGSQFLRMNLAVPDEEFILGLERLKKALSL